MNFHLPFFDIFVYRLLKAVYGIHPNGRTIVSFLSTLWRDGALFGATEEEAFFVNLGKGSTMTDDDILNGRLVCVIGVAPVRPAEFVIFRITQIMEQNG